jgi:hypothetical protein
MGDSDARNMWSSCQIKIKSVNLCILLGTSILEYFYDISFLVLSALNTKMTPSFLLNDYQYFGHDCCFPSGDTTTNIVISF